MTAPVLGRGHFQVAYVVDDARAAMHMLGGRLGVESWDVMNMTEIHGPGAPSRLIANAWVDDMMIELIEPDEAVASIYSNWMPESGQRLRLHHLGFLAPSEEEFAASKRRLADAGFPIVMEGSFGEVLDYAYADMRADFGHYYELILLKSQGDSFFGRIPIN